jgi:hypothetical protein
MKNTLIALIASFVLIGTSFSSGFCAGARAGQSRGDQSYRGMMS